MRDFTTNAILLRKYDVMDADLSLILLTDKFGKITAWTKGIRKITQKFGAYLDFFCVAELGIYSAKDKNLIKNIKILEHNYKIRLDFKKLQKAYFILQNLDNFTISGTGAELFDLARKSLQILDEKPLNECINLESWFFMRLLEKLGYKFLINECANCGLKLTNSPLKSLVFSPKVGGILCNICKAQIPQNEFFLISYDLLIVLQNLSQMKEFISLETREQTSSQIENFINKLKKYFFAEGKYLGKYE